jgi:hypothetical protein
MTDVTVQDRELLEAWRNVANSKLVEFRRQCWRLSMLVRQGVVCKQAAVDRLYEIAIAHALVRALGEERVEAIISEAFSDVEFRPMLAELKHAGLFSGEGGTGKSNIELTKDVARVTGKGWFGSMPEPDPAITLVEAIKQSVRDGGIAVLKEPATRDRLSQCDRAARAEIDRWLTRFKSKVPA